MAFNVSAGEGFQNQPEFEAAKAGAEGEDAGELVYR